MAESITIHDVARLAEVSTSSVSNLLNGRLAQMRPETQERIRWAIAQLGYAPNRAAQQLKTGHVPIIGLIVPSVANPFWGAVAHAVEAAALEHGYQVFLGNGERDPVRERRYGETLWEYGVRGVIFGSSPLSFDHLRGLADRGLHVVAFDHPTLGDDGVISDSVSVDNIEGARRAIAHLLGLGHRRIGFVSGPIRTANRLDRLAGYQAALREAGVEPDPALVWSGADSGFGDIDSAQLGRRGARELLGSPNPPTALLALNDMYAFGAYAGARDLGLRIPEAISIVGFDDIMLAEIVGPPLTTVRQPLPTMMRVAVERLIGRVAGTRQGPAEHRDVAPELIVRRSTAPPET